MSPLSEAGEKLGVQAIVIATGSEVHLALEAQARLHDEGYGVRAVSIEAGVPLSWERYTGSAGTPLGMTADAIETAVRRLLTL